MKTKVRFHLGAGENYMKWQIKRRFSTSFVHTIRFLVMKNCTLRNHEATASKIHAGANKSVCAWIECDDAYNYFDIPLNFPLENGKQISYNPKVAPYWRDEDGNNIDGMEFSTIWSNGRKLFVCS